MNRFVHALLALLWPAMLAAQATLRVTAFDDRNGNGTRDQGERPVPGVAISNQRDVATTDASGIARVERGSSAVRQESSSFQFQTAIAASGPSGAPLLLRIRN